MKKILRTGRITVAVLLLLAMVTCLIIMVLPVNAASVDQYHSGWKLIREINDEDGTSFSAVYDLTGVGTTAGNFASKDSSTVANGGPYQIHSYAGYDGGTEFQSSGDKWIFTFCGKNYNNVDDTFSFNLVGWSRINGMLQNIAEGSCTLGTQAVVIYPDGGDALGELVSETSVAYTHASTTFTVTNGAFDGVVAGMLARVTGSNLTNAIVQVTTATDANNIVCSGVTSTDNNTDSTVQINPAFWADTITLDETTKWTSTIDGSTAGSGNKGVIEVINSADNEVACLVVDLKGIEWIQFVIYDADAATGEEAGDITVYGRPYN